MKLIMENWKRYLSENWKHSGKTGFDASYKSKNRNGKPITASLFVHLYFNEKTKEYIFVEHTSTRNFLRIYNVKGEGIGWYTKATGHQFKPNQNNKFPENVEIDLSWEDDQGAKIKSLNSPKPTR